MEYIFFVLFILIIIFIAFLKTPSDSGYIGELRVSKALGKTEINSQYVINDLKFVNEGKSVQIDHLLINRTGIFVIETKNYSGRIYGSETQHNWTQVLSYGKVKHKFYNPIKQNKSHIYELSKIIGRSDCFISIIVFPKAHLMVNTVTCVGDIRTLKRIYKTQNQVIFTIDEMNEIYKKIIDIKNDSTVSIKSHINQINQMKKNIDNNICPRCNKELVLRQGKYGSFYGCSGYPNCRFKKTN